MTRHGWLCLASLALAIPACTARSGREASASECTNGRDDDEDGTTDCDDPGCDAVCTGGGDAGGGDGGFPDAGPHRDGAGGCFDPIDIVFVLDVSTSMTEEFTHLREGIASIFDATDALTTNHTFGLVVFVDDVLVVNGCNSFDSASALQAEFDHWRSFCSSNGEPGGSPGMNSDCAENSLDALYAAATTCTWRAGATHIVIHVTDDTFLERPAHFGGFGGIAAMHTYQETRDALIAAEVRVGAFAQAEPANCGAGTSANTAQGFFVSYQGQAPLPDDINNAWDIADVRSGSLDMATAINTMVMAEHCVPF